ncbi:GntR family transcriptional regulator [Terricaulis sp.]|uniref:GntR family transcriptional regulator n=1 Tax=Terricaulis sp. TaxID=2768686 RepID=UPI003782DD3F
MELDRPNISDAAIARVRDMIVGGALPDGERINEVRLAADLGVSRTPLREALNRLVAEGAIQARPRHGYFVRPLTVAEMEQIYAIRPLLDPEALRLAGVPSAKRIEELERMNRKLVATGDSAAANALDEAWHLKLLADCPNRVLVELIENFMLRTRRYELALFRETRHVRQATGDHERILDALRRGDLDAACAALKRNMESGRAPILEWLQAREVARRPR